MAARLLILTTVLATSAVAEQASVSLKLNPAAPVKGRDTTAQLEIELPAGRTAPPVLRANVGKFERVERISAGHFRAQYVLPTTRFPEVAIIVAFAPWPHPQSADGAFGVLRVPIASAVEVPGRAEKNAEVVLTIGGVAFGPVTAAPDGAFRLPVVVPPGFGIAKIETRDRVGNRRSSSIDLALPPTDQLACVVTPTLVPADGVSKARVLCATSDRYGAPTRGAKIVWGNSRGVLSAPKEVTQGVQEWSWTAPREPGDGVEKLSATWKQGPVDSADDVTVELSQGPVAAITVSTADDVAHRGSPYVATVTARDRLGRPLQGVQLTAWGAAAATDTKGVAQLSWNVDDSFALGTRELFVSGQGPFGKEPAALQAWQVDGGVMVLVTDLAGLPVPAQNLEWGNERAATDSAGVARFPAASASLELHHAEWPGVRFEVDAGWASAPVGAVASTTVTIVPAAAINVRVTAEPSGLTWWIEGADGRLLDGRSVELRDEQGPRRVTSKGRTREATARGLVSVTDLDSRVSAVIEVGP